MADSSLPVFFLGPSLPNVTPSRLPVPPLAPLQPTSVTFSDPNVTPVSRKTPIDSIIKPPPTTNVNITTSPGASLTKTPVQPVDSKVATFATPHDISAKENRPDGIDSFVTPVRAPPPPSLSSGAKPTSRRKGSASPRRRVSAQPLEVSGPAEAVQVTIDKSERIAEAPPQETAPAEQSEAPVVVPEDDSQKMVKPKERKKSKSKKSLVELD